MTTRRRFLRLLAAVPAAMPGASAGVRAQAEAPIVAAASDLQFALPEIAAAFRAATGHEVRLVFGSTGNLARQIRAGAPFALFLAADEAFVADLARDGFTRDTGSPYAIGRIVLVVPPGSPLAPDGTLGDLGRALVAGEVTRFAIANPEHAPYGRRAGEALRHAGLWERVQPFLVLGENVAQTAQFVVSGNAEGGIVAHALALAPALGGRVRRALIPADMHAPLVQRMVLLAGAGAVAGAFYVYLQAPEARAVLARHGFALPDGG